MSTPYEDVLLALDKSSSVIVSTHVAPDADALGSAGALAHMLEQAGRRAVVAVAEPVPEKLQPLLQPVHFVHEIPSESFDLLVAVDTATERRLSLPSAELGRNAERVINIDHHISNTLWGDVNLVIPGAAASAQIVFELLERGKYAISRAAANMLYMGLLDDTGSFRFSNADAAAFECAARLIAAGAEPALVAEHLYFSLPLRELRVRARALSTLRVELAGRLAIVSVDAKALADEGAAAEDTEGVVDLARSVSGTKAAVFMREMSDGWKLSFRSKDERLDVQAVAAQFGGGGHKMAAGAKVQGTAEQVESKVIAALKRAFSEAGL